MKTLEHTEGKTYTQINMKIRANKDTHMRTHKQSHTMHQKLHTCKYAHSDTYTLAHTYKHMNIHR